MSETLGAMLRTSKCRGTGPGAALRAALKSYEVERHTFLYLTNTVAQEPKGSSPHSQQLATSPYSDPVLSNPHHPPANLPKIHSDHIPIYAFVFRVVSFLRAFSPKLYTFPSYPMHATCPAHLIRLGLICLMIFGEYFYIYDA
jgi:hypothetical protein